MSTEEASRKFHENPQVRQKIFDSARRIVESDGVKSLTVSKIVRTCKISKTTFYRYYTSSADIIEQLARDVDVSNVDLLTTRRAIIQKASIAFSENAFHEIDLNTIAKAAGLKRSSVYRYFKTKEELLAESLLIETDNRKIFREELQREPFDPTLSIEKILAYGVHFSTQPYNNLMLKNVIYYASANEIIRQILEKTYYFTQCIIEDYFKKGIEAGFFDSSMDTVAISQIVLSCWLGYSIGDPEHYYVMGKKLIELFILPLAVSK
ncbi:MAG: TetR/AcrR family transcriptional regulator; helix-turn-helix transcriptional regulator [Clostridiales bacterium]|nr:TetR/AcrR family transcriptional regulator; helix-turn-helix transcriptional regulator [Clostridiales bacterium]